MRKVLILPCGSVGFVIIQFFIYWLLYQIEAKLHHLRHRDYQFGWHFATNAEISAVSLDW